MGTIVSDFDGTLCFDGRTVAPEIVAALDRIRQRHRLVIASARPPRDLRPVLPASLTDVALLGGNGAFALDGDVRVIQHLDHAARNAIDMLIAAHGLRAHIDGDGDYAYTGDGADAVIAKVHTAGPERAVTASALPVYTKVVLFTTHPSILAAVRELAVKVTVHGDEGILDIAPAGVDKATVLAHLGVGPGEYLALGNDHNDVPLFRGARHSVCVGDNSVGVAASERVRPDEVAATLDRLAELADAASAA
ncbi:HAD-IIB family hydrolase [Salinibacterium sp. ZJ70]|uniref:HAD-IIB family hydrolase n=1 Tax=Salinibacterium sp. ZJ70 TaxID=2708084 RepID=UPI001422BEF6|nr:HAD-IIB family hydrolase [Salinibacterium sp. ZJ70]